ncbi:RHS repeat-associated core domain-containing protein [Streptomyces regalis]|uniref:Golvesin/Xly CBD-like domain-containing protein n=1 Tax=Streptomyces regalis TaxID=68262 RepID=A0A0X3UYZ3_9ACTN|nr:hypothetical protein ADL12_19575 [Streptomyces regalis]
MGNEARAAIINDRRITGLSADVIAELVAGIGPLWYERHQAKLASRPRKRAMGADAKHRLVLVDRHLDEGRPDRPAGLRPPGPRRRNRDPDAFTWTLNIPKAGTYTAYVKYPQVTGAATAAKYTVTKSDGSTTDVVREQSTGAGTWVSLGSFAFTQGNAAKLQLFLGYTAYGGDDTSGFTGIDKPDAADPTKEDYNPYRFNAKRWDAQSGTHDMGFRDYSPGLNRFTTRDMYTGALADMNLGMDPYTGNRYSFIGSNPASFIELDGHLAFLAALAPVAAVAVVVVAAVVAASAVTVAVVDAIDTIDDAIDDATDDDAAEEPEPGPT